ncbi:MAG: hypothetical protein DRI57_00140 [Deltaproteobacteria bacterium]|nr:MAG: hypothetical protein DRI57_00140 [Deltaproteobacteria bacterium]
MPKELGKDIFMEAMGAHWGLPDCSEESFRNLARAELEEYLGAEVITIEEFDDEGVVYGLPEWIELDIMTRDGILIAFGLNSYVNKGRMYDFWRIVQFYEKKHKKQIDKMIAISPLVNVKANAVAESVGVTICKYPEDVEAVLNRRLPLI